MTRGDPGDKAVKEGNPGPQPNSHTDQDGSRNCCIQYDATRAAGHTWVAKKLGVDDDDTDDDSEVALTFMRSMGDETTWQNGEDGSLNCKGTR